MYVRISETLSLTIGCAPLLLWLQCQSGNCDQSTVGTLLIHVPHNLSI